MDVTDLKFGYNHLSFFPYKALFIILSSSKYYISFQFICSFPYRNPLQSTPFQMATIFTSTLHSIHLSTSNMHLFMCALVLPSLLYLLNDIHYIYSKTRQISTFASILLWAYQLCKVRYNCMKFLK